jgi:hypothetical protein
MAEKKPRVHGFKKTFTVFAAYKPDDPASVTEAAKKLADVEETLVTDTAGVEVINTTPAVPHSIPSK